MVGTVGAGRRFDSLINESDEFSSLESGRGLSDGEDNRALEVIMKGIDRMKFVDGIDNILKERNKLKVKTLEIIEF